jgi:DNA (cytosine-5)-methyltransferase 1
MGSEPTDHETENDNDPSEARFSFVDLFAGIGGIRLGLEAHHGRCVYSVEWDRWACRTYRANFNRDPEDDGTLWEGDIRDVVRLPEHDLLAAGFPCQPFSIAGVSKKQSLGRPHGFLDETQGTLFYEIARLAKLSDSPVLLLENVKNLERHDRGRTFTTIRNVLEQDLGYRVSSRVIDGAAWVPQHRERIYIVAINQGRFPGGEFVFPEPPPPRRRLTESFFDPDPDPVYTKSVHVWQYLQDYAAKHRAAGNGFGYGLVGPGDTARTLSARYYKDGSEILVRQGDGPPRMLTPDECRRLMGFPESFRTDAVSRTQAYKQFGNSVVVPAVEFVVAAIVEQGFLPVPARERPSAQQPAAQAGAEQAAG